MQISKARDKYLFTTKIYLDQNKDGLPDESGDYIVLREPTIQEMQLFKDDEKKNFETLEKLFPKCLIDHSFYDDEEETVKSDTKAVHDLIKESGSLFPEVIDIWFKSIPFSSRIRKREKSDNSQD
jgi:hypothetical protein